ncbi:hypothetical protein [Pseudomonas brassicacearum]|uniref:hypothetical protein n=1 Tax=Pseudomonas brassicacearum TaxID=930166 RepID=UPI001364C718|nr:hypothetical protein [Pseudomonas brassicacearum]
MFVQFLDEDETKIIGVFNAPQDPEAWPNQGIVEADDPRWIDFEEEYADLIH